MTDTQCFRCKKEFFPFDICPAAQEVSDIMCSVADESFIESRPEDTMDGVAFDGIEKDTSVPSSVQFDTLLAACEKSIAEDVLCQGEGGGEFPVTVEHKTQDEGSTSLGAAGA